MKTAIAYTRVSTAQQGKSGLGLEAQQAALVRFAEAVGFDLVQTFQEVETGKGAERSTGDRSSPPRSRRQRN
jgi:DNA invertase Pin-like site-specific DNA recombinase